MELWDEILTPSEVTASSRGIAEALEQDDITQQLLPTETTDDIRVQFEVFSGSGREDGEPIRAWDTEAAIGGGAGGELRFAEVVPAAWKVRFSEYENLRRQNRTDAQSVASAVESRQKETVNVILAELRKLRSEALLTGKLSINQRRVVQNVDFGRRPDFTTTAATPWDQPGADPMGDMEQWAEAFAAENGEEAEYTVIGRQAAAALLGNGQIGDLFPVSTATLTGINDALVARGLPPLVVNPNRKVLSQKHALLVKPGVDALGSTLWGPTAEAQDERYGIPDASQPGLVTGLYRTVDPIAVWVHSAASYLPLLKNANLSFAAKVLA